MMRFLRHAVQQTALFALMFMAPLGAMAQGNVITGTVDSDDGPVIGATVQVKGAKGTGAVTDLDGHYKIQAPKGATLVISFLGYQSQEVKANAQGKADST